ESLLQRAEMRCNQYAEAYDSLLAQIKEFQRHRFGKKSERFVDPENPQISLFSENKNSFTIADTASDNITDEVSVPAHIRKKKNKKEKDLPVRIEIIPVPDEQKQCSCGKCKQVIRYET